MLLIEDTESIESLNYAESYCSDFKFINNFMVISFSNVQVMDNAKGYFENHKSQNIDLISVLFEDVKTLTYSYDVSRNFKGLNRLCYGGRIEEMNSDLEFWVDCINVKILISKEALYSKKPFLNKLAVASNSIDRIIAEIPRSVK